MVGACWIMPSGSIGHGLRTRVERVQTAGTKGTGRRATLTARPAACSGLAYSGVINRRTVAVGSRDCVESSGSRIFAMPKSSSFGQPFASTRMFPGLMSR